MRDLSTTEAILRDKLVLELYNTIVLEQGHVSAYSHTRRKRDKKKLDLTYLFSLPKPQFLYFVIKYLFFIYLII